MLPETDISYSKQVSWRLWFAMFSCAIGTSFQFGYNTGVLNPPQQVLGDFLNQTYTRRNDHVIPGSLKTFLWSLVVAIYAVSGMLGGLSAGWFTDKFGRKLTMLLNNAFLLTGGGLMFGSRYARSYEMLIVGRFIIGFGCGIGTAVAPVYLSEIAKKSFRGAAGTFNQLIITTGTLISQILGLTVILGNSWGWHYLLGLTVVPSVIQLLTLPFCPETPRFLYIARDATYAATDALQWLRGVSDVQEDLKEMDIERITERNTYKVGLVGLFRSQELRTPLLISVVMQLSMQLSGILAVVFYSTRIFENAGLSEHAAQYATLSTSAVNVCMTFVSAVLVDRLGRRTLQLYGLAGMWLFSITLTVSLLWKDLWVHMPVLSIISVLLFIVAFAIGPGPIPWFIVAELFAQGPRPAAMSVAMAVNWLANFAVGIGFPAIQKSIGDYSFVPFIGFLTIFWIFTYLKVPETKNRSIEEIAALFRKRNSAREYRRISESLN